MSGPLSPQAFAALKRSAGKMDYHPSREDIRSLIATVEARDEQRAALETPLADSWLVREIQGLIGQLKDAGHTHSHHCVRRDLEALQQAWTNPHPDGVEYALTSFVSAAASISQAWLSLNHPDFLD